MKLSAWSVMAVFGDLAVIEQGATARPILSAPRGLFGEIGILVDDEARRRSSLLAQRSAVGPKLGGR
jgi:hypothetical protein